MYKIHAINGFQSCVGFPKTVSKNKPYKVHVLKIFYNKTVYLFGVGKAWEDLFT